MISSIQTLHQGSAVPLASPRRGPRTETAATSGIITDHVTRVQKGQPLYLEGEEPTAPYLVKSGVLRVIIRAASGKERLADLAGPGDLLATSVFDGSANAETVIAASEAEAATVDVHATLARVRGRQALAAALVRQLTRSREMADDLGLPMGARICRILARVAERLGDEIETTAAANDHGWQWRHLPFSLTHDDVALLAGCARVTATRVLGELKEAKVLDGHRGNYSVVPSALDAAADRYVYEVL